jgi:protein AbiQ
MNGKLYLCSIEDRYINYLRQFDEIVLINKDTKRKYVGVLFQIGNLNYYAPLSSPKPKHLNISDKAPDIFKIDNGKLGVINLNNMIPVPEFEIIRINIEEIEDEKYKNLLRDQARFINKYREKIKKKARVLYSIVNSNSNPNLNKRCCNYKLLEIKCKEYETVALLEEIATTLEDNE